MFPPEPLPAAPSPGPAAPETLALDIDVVFPLIADPARRRILESLARQGPKGVLELAGAVGRKPSATGKHLFELRKGGLVVDSPTRASDRRKQLYELAPVIRSQMREGLLTLDFGFCLLRL